MQNFDKNRYWWAVLYPEDMISDWKETIEDCLQLPFCYCIHNKSRCSDGEERKEHIHCILVFPNTTTYNHALSIFNQLSLPGKKCANTCKPCYSIRHCYDYLIHDTESARKANKEPYDPSERISGNCFDIGAYEQIGIDEKQSMFHELCDVIVVNRFSNILDLYQYLNETYFSDPELGNQWFSIYTGYNHQLSELCKGVYNKEAAAAKMEAAAQKMK